MVIMVTSFCTMPLHEIIHAAPFEQWLCMSLTWSMMVQNQTHWSAAFTRLCHFHGSMCAAKIWWRLFNSWLKLLGLLGNGCLQPKMDWYPPSLGRWSHSPLHNKKDALTIQCAGRWTSTTFMDYIHGQLDVTTHGLVQAMSMQTPYHNMAQWSQNQKMWLIVSCLWTDLCNQKPEPQLSNHKETWPCPPNAVLATGRHEPLAKSMLFYHHASVPLPQVAPPQKNGPDSILQMQIGV